MFLAELGYEEKAKFACALFLKAPDGETAPEPTRVLIDLSFGSPSLIWLRGGFIVVVLPNLLVEGGSSEFTVVVCASKLFSLVKLAVDCVATVPFLRLLGLIAGGCFKVLAYVKFWLPPLSTSEF